MSFQGVLLINVFGLLFLAAIVALVRTRRLHVGYGVLWMVATLGMMLVVSIPPLRQGVTRLVGAVYPASALTLLAFVFLFALIVHFSVQLSRLSERHAELVQTLAIRELRRREDGRRAHGAERTSGGPSIAPATSPAGREATGAGDA